MNRLFSITGNVKRLKKDKSTKNDNVKDGKNILIFLAAIIGVPQLLLVIFMVLMIIIVGSYLYEENRMRFFEEDEVIALADSISMAGEDFYKLLELYMIKKESFDNYKREVMRECNENLDEEYDKLIERVENAPVGQKSITRPGAFKYKYEGIVQKGNDNNMYYTWYFPIPMAYDMRFNDDFGYERTDGRPKHEGIDVFAKEGTPIIAIEGGQVSSIGWNEYGGWTISIKSNLHDRYWYYAHLRKLHPYVKGLKLNDFVETGQVIGYVGATGNLYPDSTNRLNRGTLPENVSSENLITNGLFPSHIHLEVSYMRDGKKHKYNAYPILRLCEPASLTVVKNGDDYQSVRVVHRFFGSLDPYDLGALSKKYESSGDPGIIARNPNDPGGPSYGAYQFATYMGTMDVFIRWLYSKDRKLFNILSTAKKLDGNTYGRIFDRAWKKIAEEDSEYFYKLQYLFTKESYYDVVAVHFRRIGVIDLDTRSIALRSVVFSTAVQHGTGGAIDILNKQNLGGDDREIIIGIYESRKNLVYYSNLSPAIKQSVINRYEYELVDALEMLRKGG